MTSRHLALIVEDDAATADDLREIVASLDCDSKTADNKRDALALVGQHEFCLVLLDLQIKAEPDSILGHKAHGNALLRDILRICASKRTARLWTPLLVVSGYAKEPNQIVEMMKEGVDDIVQKPLIIEEVSRKVRAALQDAGRELHSTCCTERSSVWDSGRIIIEFTGHREGRRTIVTVSDHDVPLPDSSLTLLLQLAIAHEKGQFVHQRELGHKAIRGFKGISRLRGELRSALGRGVDIVDNDHHGALSANMSETPRSLEFSVGG